MEKIEITHSSGATVEIYRHGAHITSWKSPVGKELMFVSKEAIFKPPKAIRGGVPVCFPQFSDMGPAGSHGFARNSSWDVISAAENKAVLSFVPSKEQLQQYPHPFELLMEIEVTESELLQVMTVKNTGSDQLEFTTALHTYLRISEIGNVKVQGLSGLEYMNNLTARSLCKEEIEEITIAEEVDRIYLNAPDKITIVDTGSGVFTLEKKNLPDAVLWNPWIAKSKATADFGDEEYHEMVCLEPAVAGSGAQAVAAGASWSCTQKLTWSPSA